MKRLINRFGWALMGIPWWSDATMTRSFRRQGLHARIYFLGGRLSSYDGFRRASRGE